MERQQRLRLGRPEPKGVQSQYHGLRQDMRPLTTLTLSAFSPQQSSLTLGVELVERGPRFSV